MICHRQQLIEPDHSRHRRGMMTIDLITAAIILGAAMTVALPMLKIIKLQRRSSASHQEAVAAAGNIMEQLSAKPYEELTPELANSISAPQWLQEQLDEPSLKIEIENDDQAKLRSKRIRLQLAWNEAPNQPSATVRLSSWVYQQENNR